MLPIFLMNNKAILYLFPSLRNIFFLVVFLAALRQGNQMLNAEGDLGHHLAMGRLILETGSIPHTDPFSFRTEGIAAIPHEWLVQSAYALLDDWFGLTGIVVLSALLLASAFTLVLTESTRRGGMLVAGLVMTALALAASAMHWITRPHLFTYLLLAVWVFRLEAFMRGEERRWWIFPPLMFLWANLHGMFILGLLAFAISLTGWAWERWLEGRDSPVSGRGLLLLGLFSTLATFLTPSGFHLWETIFTLAGASPFITSMTAEYQPADFHNPGTWPFLILLGAILATAVLAGRKLGMARALQLSGWTLIGLYSARNIPLAAIVLAPIGAELLAAWLRESPALAGLVRFSRKLERVERDLRGWLWAVAGVLLCLVLLASGVSLALDGQPYQLLPERFPMAAVDWLKENPPTGRMFNEFDWGGYLLYRLWPEQKIFMDGHTHIYGDALSREYVAIQSRAPGWESLLDNYRVEWAILRTDNPLTLALIEVYWREVYRDETAVVLKR
jgi:hypothetical protein